MKIIQTQKEFDNLASQQCKANNGNNSEDCTENWKAGYLYALEQIDNFMFSDKYKSDFELFRTIENKLDELQFSIVGDNEN